MKIDYVTIGNASDIHNWSGLEYNIAQTLGNHVGQVNYIGNLKIKDSFYSFNKRLLYRLFGNRIVWAREPSFAQQCANQVKSRIQADTDIVFSPGTVATALLETNKPKVIYTDICFATYSSTYYSDVSNLTIRNGNYLEKKALDSASLSLFSSEYGARTAIDYYNLNPEKVKVVPFGANINHNLSRDVIKEKVLQRRYHECHLIFIGVQWERKGGDLAVKIAEKLNKMGLRTILHIVGIKKIPLKEIPWFIEDHGFISKADLNGEKKLIELISSCHFLLLPTRVEAYGLVFCEANSLGLPAVTTNVGGITTIIKDDINGKMFSLEQEDKDYADYIFSVFNDRNKYVQLSLSSYDEYEERLNWNVAGKKIACLLQAL